ncbi:hypothetical protein [Desulfovibrio ferrophilus]|uniref:Uncharacterized protein n=1 Tax=Desulfovibrio ferrophilus TaxID=241368 RepID=A0A2Z6AW58_9BACT|nr:hypothetical protein [Desulfovibrio ferrophilus]BBD07468.1 uncharacterized protein DFE_0742 [Desulfovibrio ferrophilus]
MADNVRHFPACACRHYELGHCLYEERLNPGFRERWRCKVLTEWEKAYDDFLLRAEAFHLKPEEAVELWEARLERLMAQARQCPDFSAGAEESATGCLNELEGLCMKMLPECDGRCRHYTILKSDNNINGCDD